MKILIGCLFLMMLSGCFNGSMLTSRHLIASGWAQPPEPYAPAAVYCYKTLGGADCYPEPVPDMEGRLISYYPKVPPVPSGLRTSQTYP